MEMARCRRANRNTRVFLRPRLRTAHCHVTSSSFCEPEQAIWSSPKSKGRTFTPLLMRQGLDAGRGEELDLKVKLL